MKGFLAALLLTLSVQAKAADKILPFTLPVALTDTTYSTASSPNGVFVLEFFALFCPSCNENSKNVSDLATFYKDNANIQVLGMDLDARTDQWQEWKTKHSPTYKMIVDSQKTVWRQVGSRYIPTTVIVDCNMDVKYKYVGSWGSAQVKKIKAVVDDLLTKPCVTLIK